MDNSCRKSGVNPYRKRFMEQLQQKTRNLKIVYFIYFFSLSIIVTYINLYYKSIGLNGKQIGLINTMGPLVGIFSGTIWGMLNDRYGRARFLLSIAAIGAAFAMTGVPFVQTFVWLLPIIGLWSLFNTAIGPILDNLNLSFLGEHKERYGKQRIWGSIGAITSMWVCGFIFQRFGYQMIFPLYVGVVIVLVLAFTLLPNQSVRLAKPTFQGLTRIIRQPTWIVFSSSVFLFWLAMGGMYAFLAIYLQTMGMKAGQIGIVAGLAPLAETIAMFFSVPLLKKLGPFKLLMIAFLMGSIRLLLYSIMPTPNWAFVIAFFHMGTFGFFWIASVTYANQLAPDNLKATGQGLLQGVMNIALVIGSPISGVLYDRIGPSALFLTYSGVCLCALILFWLGTRITVRMAPKLQVTSE
jgi:MFS transporter, PPP family, 3-phenylpropionic acid transporter